MWIRFEMNLLNMNNYSIKTEGNKILAINNKDIFDTIVLYKGHNCDEVFQKIMLLLSKKFLLIDIDDYL